MINKVIKYVFGIGLGISILFFCAYNDTHYTRIGYIKHTHQPNLYIFVDETKNEWEFTDSDLLIPYNTVVNVAVKMFTNNTTDYIYDDMIVDMEFMSANEN